MDGRRFDHLTKTLATGTSRRRVVGGIAAALGGLVLGRRSAADAAQYCVPKGRACPTFRPYTCCTNFCDDSRDSRPGVGRCRACTANADCAFDDPDPCIRSECLDGRCVVLIYECAEGFYCCDGAKICCRLPD